MSTSVAMSFTVGTKDFRQALRAVLPHASTDTKFPAICRLRLYVDGENVTVAATDRYTAALGLVSVWESDVPTVGPVDLSLPDVAMILAVFTAGKESSTADTPEWQLKVELLSQRTRRAAGGDVEHATVRVTDVSGLISGEVLEFPVLPADTAFPDLPGLFSKYLSRPAGLLDAFSASGDLLARLKVAGRVYDHPLLLSTPGDARSPIVARCGDSFVGLVMPKFIDEDTAAQNKRWLEDWLRRLPEPGVVDLDDMSGHARSERQRLRAAATLVITTQFGSPVMLQRRLMVGLAEANGLLDRLEGIGVVGPKDGAGAREVVAKPQQLQKVLDEIGVTDD